MCAVLGVPFGISQAAGHSGLVRNVYSHNIDTVRSQFLVCKWKMLLECHTKRGVGAYHRVPVSHQSSEDWVFIIECSLCFYFIV